PDWHIYRDPVNWRSEKTVAEMKEELGKPISTEILYGRSITPMPRELAQELGDRGNAWIQEQFKNRASQSVRIDDIIIGQKFVFEKPLRRYMGNTLTEEQIPV